MARWFFCYFWPLLIFWARSLPLIIIRVEPKTKSRWPSYTCPNQVVTGRSGSRGVPEKVIIIIIETLFHFDIQQHCIMPYKETQFYFYDYSIKGGNIEKICCIYGLFLLGFNSNGWPEYLCFSVYLSARLPFPKWRQSFCFCLWYWLFLTSYPPRQFSSECISNIHLSCRQNVFISHFYMMMSAFLSTFL